MYKLARMGIEVERQSRTVTIYELACVPLRGANLKFQSLVQGTLSRSRIGFGTHWLRGCMSDPAATRSSGFSLETPTRWKWLRPWG
jgi:tRNA U55 pseudouridine synthase TruB